MVIIPDIHGRQFWREAVESAKEGEEIIFLGDYLDHYNHEYDPATQSYITEESAIDNFKDIIAFAKSKQNVTLLLGNHDTEYFLGTPECRRYDWHLKEIKELFEGNRKLFKVLYTKVFAGNKFVFSHSFLSKNWVEQTGKFEDSDSIDNVIESINAMPDEELGKILGQVGYARWGEFPYGSCVWSDLSETENATLFEGVFQIFAHSQQRKYPIYADKFAMLDCRQSFRLNEQSGLIECISVTEDPQFNQKSEMNNLSSNDNKSLTEPKNEQ